MKILIQYNSPQLITFSYLMIILLFLSCEKWNLDLVDFVEVITSDPIDQGGNSLEVIVYGEIKGLSSENSVEQHGHLWSSLVETPTLVNKEGQTTFLKKGNGAFSSTLEELIPGAKYYYRAYALDGDQPVYGEVKSFTNNSISFDGIIEFVSNPVQVVDRFEVDVMTTISNVEEDILIADYGIVWGTAPLPTIEEQRFLSKSSTTSDGTTITFTERLTDIQPGDNFIRPFLIIGGLVLYGQQTIYKVEGVWIRRSDLLGQSQSGPSVFSINGKGYLGAGNEQKEFWEFDPATNVWTQKANFSGLADRFATGFSIDNIGYVYSGQGGDLPSFVVNEFWAYDPQTNTWTEKAIFGDEGRRAASSFTINGKGYVGLGSHFLLENNVFRDFWEYDPPTDTWTQKADFGGVARYGAVGFSIGEKGYFGTGRDRATPTRYDDFWEYDPQTDTWSEIAKFEGEARSSAVGFSVGEKGYVGTGINSSFMSEKDFWEYDPENNTWTQKTDFDGLPGNSGVGFSILDRGYLFMGSLRNDFWEYVPEKE